MEDTVLRHLVRSLIAEGRLPVMRQTHVWGGPGTGMVCAACGELVRKTEVGIETSDGADGTNTFQLHVHCFHVWESETRGIEEGRITSPRKQA